MNPPSTSSVSGPQRSLSSQIVLEEDEYTAALSDIIARDFFPSLVKLDATNDYLDAIHSRDQHLINASVRRLEHVSQTPSSLLLQTPSQTPFGVAPSETPLHTRGRPSHKRPKLDTELSLDAFQARYTSEDNSSFADILDDENRRRKEKWAWAWDAQKRVEGQRERMIESRERMMIEAPPATGVKERLVIDAAAPVGLLTHGSEDGEDNEKEPRREDEDASISAGGSNKGKQVTASTKDSEPEVDVMAPVKDTRSAGVDGWRFKARNSFMFSPDADLSPYRPSLGSSDVKGDPKTIKHGNTRLSASEFSPSTLQSHSSPPSPTRSRIEAAINGTSYRPRSPTNISLVPDLPSPTAAELGPAAVKQLMTWGTLDATPRIISQSDNPVEFATPSTPFHIPAVSSRESISHKLSSSASKSLRAKAGLLGLGQLGRTPGIIASTPGGGMRGTRGKGSMPPPSWTPRRSEAAGNLTPAARRLLERSTLGTTAMRRAEAMERTARWEGGKNANEKDLNRMRWTPAPSPSSGR